jgi:hypothetical protein
MTRNRDLGDVAPFVDGVSSNIQTQINAKAPIASPTFTGTITADSRVDIQAASGFATLEMGGPSGAFLDMKAPFSDDYDGRIQYDAGGAGAFIINTNSGNSSPVVIKQQNSEKLRTTATGIQVTGNLNVLAQGSVRMEDAAGGQYAAFQAPTTLTASYIMTMPPNTGSAGQFLQTNGSGVLSFSGVGSSTNVITSNTTATKDNHYYVNGSAITLTLPASPSVGDEVRFSEIAGNTNNVIARNSSNIMSSATDLTVDTAFAVLYLRYVDATIGWALS